MLHDLTNHSSACFAYGVTLRQRHRSRSDDGHEWLLPVLLIPKPLNPALWYNHSMFMGLYLASFFLEKKPCTICTLVFLAALFFICYSCQGNCVFYSCTDGDV
ncbi:hypothetical protein Bbelb_230310 [Branchiostoma belcheri]|nr:hypothetical protein Bbelb_230310 [Branchiostoma belcheri]